MITIITLHRTLNSEPEEVRYNAEMIRSYAPTRTDVTRTLENGTTICFIDGVKTYVAETPMQIDHAIEDAKIKNLSLAKKVAEGAVFLR